MLFTFQDFFLLASFYMLWCYKVRKDRFLAALLGYCFLLNLAQGSWQRLYPSNHPILFGFFWTFVPGLIFQTLIRNSRWFYSEVDVWLCEHLFKVDYREVKGVEKSGQWLIGPENMPGSQVTLGALGSDARYQTSRMSEISTLEEAKKELQRVIVSG